MQDLHSPAGGVGVNGGSHYWHLIIRHVKKEAGVNFEGTKNSTVFAEQFCLLGVRNRRSQMSNCCHTVYNDTLFTFTTMFKWITIIYICVYSPAASCLPHRALQRVFGGNRTLMLTRSSFPGVGKYSGHWLGDNGANWNDIRWAIPGMLEFSLFGVPYVSTIKVHSQYTVSTRVVLSAASHHLSAWHA